MRTILSTGAAAFLAVGVAPAAQAEGGGWRYSATFYVFAAETTSRAGGREATLSFSDALDNLDRSLMGVFEARRGPWTLAFDYMLTDLSVSGDVPDASYGRLDASTRTEIASFIALYDVHATQYGTYSIGGGARWFDTETRIDLSAGTEPAASAASAQSWTDPVLAARATWRLRGDWTATAYGDYGGFVDDRTSLQFLLTADWAFAENWVARLGYRYLDIRNDAGGTGYGFEQSGPIAGITYRF